MDGIDAALVDFNEHPLRLLEHISYPLPPPLRQNIFHLAQNSNPDLNLLGETDARVGEVFADAANALLDKSNRKAVDIRAIGSHGQTIWHNPDTTYRFSLQIGDANRIAYRTGITTVADFRRRDMAAGGQGAPLAPAFHRAIFTDPKENRAVVNIGGIANITWLPAGGDGKIIGFDCGPANVLMDHWISEHHHQSYDRNGSWAASAEADEGLVAHLMQDAYLHREPPKSTGREHYHLVWLRQQLRDFGHLPTEVVQASLCEFTARSIHHALTRYLPALDRLIVCGGGAHNIELMRRLKASDPRLEVDSSEDHGLHPDWVEAVAFAWLAKQTLEHRAVDLKDITGARENVILGAIYPA